MDTAALAAAVTSTATTTTTSTSVEERRAAMEGISAQCIQYRKSRSNTVTKAEMEKYRKTNIPWD